MKPERNFIAERALAQHCAELLRPAPPPADPSAMLARAGGLLTRTLGPALTPLFAGECPDISAKAPRTARYAEVLADTPPLAAHSLLAAGPDNTPLLLTMEAGGVLELVDRAFGGRGEVPATLPEAFSLSAELLIARLECLIAPLVAQALGIEQAGAMPVLRRCSALEELAPFAADRALSLLDIEIGLSDSVPWTLSFAIPTERLVAVGDAAQAPGSGTAPPVPRGPEDEPFSGLTLPLRAVLVDMELPLSAISRIAPGAVLPVSVARSIPLMIGTRTLASGTIGAMDDRVAVQITHAP